jgi:flagellar hook-length control protein FliK
VNLPLIHLLQNGTAAKAGFIPQKDGVKQANDTPITGEGFTLDATDAEHLETLVLTPSPVELEVQDADWDISGEAEFRSNDADITNRETFPILAARAAKMKVVPDPATAESDGVDGAMTMPRAPDKSSPDTLLPASQAVQLTPVPVTQTEQDQTAWPEKTDRQVVTPSPGLTSKVAGSAVTFAKDAMVVPMEATSRPPPQDAKAIIGLSDIVEVPETGMPDDSTGPLLGNPETARVASSASAHMVANASAVSSSPLTAATASVHGTPDPRMSPPQSVGEQDHQPEPVLERAPRVSSAPAAPSAPWMPAAVLQMHPGAFQANLQEITGLVPEDVSLGPLDNMAEIALGERTTATAASLHATIARPEMPRHLAGQMAQALRGHSGGPVEISLQPEELGRVRMTVSTTDAAVIIAIVAERQDTFEMMRRHATALSRELANLGFEGVELSFEQRGGGHAERPFSQDGSGFSSSRGGAHGSEDPLHMELIHVGGLDPTKALDKRI